MAEPDWSRVDRNMQRLVQANAPDDDIAAYLASEELTIEQFRDHLIEPAPPEGASDIGAIVSGLGSRGPAYALGAPVDLANMALDLGLGGVQEVVEEIEGEESPDWYNVQAPVGGSQWMLDQIEGIGIPARIPPRTGTGAVLSRGAEELGAALTGIGVAAPVRSAGGAIGGIARSLSDQPITQAVSSATAGLAAGGAEQAFPDNPTAQMAAALLGGVGGAMGSQAVGRAAQSLYDSGRDLASMFTQPGQTRLAGAAIRNAATDPQGAAANIRSAQQQLVPGSYPITADVASDTGLSTTTRGLSQNPALPLHSMLDERLTANDAARRAALGQVGGDITPEAAGSVIRSGFDQAYGTAQDLTDAAYDAVRAAGNPDIPTTNALVRANAIVEQYYGPGGGTPPQAIQSFIENLRASVDTPGQTPGTLPFSTLQRMRQQAGNLAAQLGSTSDRIGASVANQLRDEIDNAIAAAAQSGAMDPTQASLLSQAQQLRTQQGDLFERGPLGALSQETGGVPRVLDSAVPATVTRSYESGRQFGISLANQPNAQQALRDYLMTQLTDDRNVSGRLGPTEMARFNRNFGATLRGLQDSGVISSQHATTIQSVMDDIARHADAMAQGTGRGSSTYQNLSLAQALEEATGGVISAPTSGGGLVVRMIRSVIEPSQDRIRQIISQALMDPELAAQLLERATPDRWAGFWDAFRSRIIPTAGISAAVQAGQEQ